MTGALGDGVGVRSSNVGVAVGSLVATRSGMAVAGVARSVATTAGVDVACGRSALGSVERAVGVCTAASVADDGVCGGVGT
jgi:hypothetical protein